MYPYYMRLDETNYHLLTRTNVLSDHYLSNNILRANIEVRLCRLTSPRSSGRFCEHLPPR